jgi:bacillithiol biosynthesis deacetylase BshB1
MAEIKLDALAIAAHPDDVEITCGGTLIKMADLGRKTGVLDLTRGEMGTRGDENDRDAEAAAAAEAMVLSYRGNAELPDSKVENNTESRLKIAQVIRDTQPELLILPHWEQRHPDHLVCSRLGYDAAFIAGLKKAELDGEPFRPRKIIYVSYFRNSDYSFLVDISEQFERKVLAVAAYQSQFGTGIFERAKEMLKTGLNLYDLFKSGGKDIFAPGVNMYDLLETRGRQLGQLVGAQYGEAYTIKEQILIDDPVAMPVRSI